MYVVAKVLPKISIRQYLASLCIAAWNACAEIRGEAYLKSIRLFRKSTFVIMIG